MRASWASLESRVCRCSSSRPWSSLFRNRSSKPSAFCWSSCRCFSASSSNFCLSLLCSIKSTIFRCVLRSTASVSRFASASSASSFLILFSAAATSAAPAPLLFSEAEDDDATPLPSVSSLSFAAFDFANMDSNIETAADLASAGFFASSSSSSSAAAAASLGTFLLLAGSLAGSSSSSCGAADALAAAAAALREEAAEGGLDCRLPSTTGRAPRCKASTTAWKPFAAAMASAVSPRLLTTSRMAPSCSNSWRAPNWPP
mmetsp:Transcript_44628/g.128057  ORF Transcript_44628/g.128057 Transcript_44628/m.128057 type:complete len:259 (-) Transcript_44628:798-1574(-)